MSRSPWHREAWRFQEWEEPQRRGPLLTLGEAGAPSLQAPFPDRAHSEPRPAHSRGEVTRPEDRCVTLKDQEQGGLSARVEREDMVASDGNERFRVRFTQSPGFPCIGRPSPSG